MDEEVAMDQEVTMDEERSEAAVSLDGLDGLDVEEFTDAVALETWLEAHHDTSRGIWVRLYTVRSGRPTVGFEEMLALGLRFGWSESTRRSYDTESYFQRFAPRRSRRSGGDGGTWWATRV